MGEMGEDEEGEGGAAQPPRLCKQKLLIALLGARLHTLTSTSFFIIPRDHNIIYHTKFSLLRSLELPFGLVAYWR